MLGVGQDGNTLMGEGSTLALQGLSSNESSGTAVASQAAIVFSWS